MQVHEFDKSLKVGGLGEKLLQATYPELKWEGGVEHDFKLPDGRYMELKTDTYNMNRTPNFFMEQYSDDKNFKLGGPWRTLDEGTDVFLYMFPENNKLFWFDDVQALVEELERLVAQNKVFVKYIPNRGRWGSGGYNTIGYQTNRNYLTNLFTMLNLGEPLPI